MTAVCLLLPTAWHKLVASIRGPTGAALWHAFDIAAWVKQQQGRQRRGPQKRQLQQRGGGGSSSSNSSSQQQHIQSVSLMQAVTRLQLCCDCACKGVLLCTYLSPTAQCTHI
jgi:hypothetical protein